MREWQRKRVVGLVRCECCVCGKYTIDNKTTLSQGKREAPCGKKWWKQQCVCYFEKSGGVF